MCSRDNNVTLQPNIKIDSQQGVMYMKASVHPLYPAISCTYLIIVYVNEDMILGRFATMNHNRYSTSQQLKDGKTESLHTTSNMSDESFSV